MDPSWLSDVERNGTHDLLYSDICKLVRATQPPRPEWWDEGYEHDLNLGPNAVVGPLTPSQQEYWARIEAVRSESVVTTTVVGEPPPDLEAKAQALRGATRLCARP